MPIREVGPELLESKLRNIETLIKGPTISNTRVTVETHETGNWLATLDMDLGKGQRFTFSSLVPIDQQTPLASIQEDLIWRAAELLLAIQEDRGG